MSSMQLSALLSHVGYIRIRGSARTEVKGIACDSRQVQPGDLFVCIPGRVHDGHAFAGEAMERGACGIVAQAGSPLSGRLEKGWTKGALVLVSSSRKSLSPMAAAFYGYPLRSMTSVAVTGTKGKTTTAYMLRQIFEQAGHRTGLIGTNGAFIGEKRLELSRTTPEAHELQKILRQMKDSGCTHVVMEVSSQGIKMERVGGLKFTCGVFTNISPDHIGPGEHESFEEYLYQKSRLFSSCGLGLANGDDPFAGQIAAAASCPMFFFGMKKGDYRADGACLVRGEQLLGCGYRLAGRAGADVALPLPGDYNIRNSLGAIGAAHLLGVPAGTAAEALKTVRIPGRTELVPGSPGLWVVVDYAHNEDSMENLLKTLRAYKPRRLICVFGCGGDRSVLRRRGMGRAAGKWADFSVLTADNSRGEPLSSILEGIEAGMKETGGDYVMIPDRREAIDYAVRHGKPGDIIALVGKGHEEYQETKGKRVRFSDREEAERAIRTYR